MVVIPADYKINLEHLEQELGVRHVELAHEKEFRNLFPDCEPGAMPPLGELYDIEVFIDESFADHEMISFNAGTHKEIIKMRYKDFQCLVGAKSINFLLVFTRE
jgi:Ala-tRNA(Pro) deacylase